MSLINTKIYRQRPKQLPWITSLRMGRNNECSLPTLVHYVRPTRNSVILSGKVSPKPYLTGLRLFAPNCERASQIISPKLIAVISKLAHRFANRRESFWHVKKFQKNLNDARRRASLPLWGTKPPDIKHFKNVQDISFIHPIRRRKIPRNQRYVSFKSTGKMGKYRQKTDSAK